MPLSSLSIAKGHTLCSVNFIEVHCYGSDLNSGYVAFNTYSIYILKEIQF